MVAVASVGWRERPCGVEAADHQVVRLGEQVAVDVGGDLHRAVAEPVADLEQIGTDGNPQGDG
jgi:hypothetical protein